MQEKQIIIMDQGKFKLIASSRMATCYHPTPEGMGIRAVISIIIFTLLCKLYLMIYLK